MICIYCRRESTASKGVPHVFPEAFAQNRTVLPIGSVCDPCNNYLGHELDSVFVSHPVISALAQFLRFPGKSGKLRKQLGNVVLGDSPRTITIPCAKPTIVTHADASQSSTITPLIDPSFDFQKFRRAIYHIAFNTYTLQRGATEALDTRFDPVRRYIKAPKPKESWPIVQYMNLGVGFTRDVTMLVDGDDAAEFVGMVICAGAAFGVDLLNSGRLESWMRRQFPPTAELISAEYRVPRTQRETGKGPRYRVTIYLDE
jgi:hypothetical protein